MKSLKNLLIPTTAYLLLFTPKSVFASPLLDALKKANPIKGKEETFAEWFATIPDELINIGAILFVVVVLIGGLQYMMALGNEESTTKAKSTLTYGLIGLIIIALAKAVMEFIKQQLPNLFR